MLRERAQAWLRVKDGTQREFRDVPALRITLLGSEGTLMAGRVLGHFDGDLAGPGANLAGLLAQGVEELQIDRIGNPYVVGQRIELVRDPFIKRCDLDLRTRHKFALQLDFHDGTTLVLCAVIYRFVPPRACSE